MTAVTVIIPTFNRARLLRRALRSALGQSFTDFEVIVVDDGSVDDTPQQVATFDDARLRYVQLPRNGGVTAARNRALRLAQSEYIAFLDSDDSWHREKLKKQVEKFRASSRRVGLIYTGHESIKSSAPPSVIMPMHCGNVYTTMLSRNVIWPTSTVMIRSDVVDRIGFMDERFPAIEDYDYWLRISRHYDVDFIQKPLARYYDYAPQHHPSTAGRMSLNLPKNLLARQIFFEKHADEIRRYGSPHRFLLTTAWQCRKAGRLADARRTAWRARQEHRACPWTHLLLAYLYSPLLAQEAALAIHRALRGDAVAQDNAVAQDMGKQSK